LARADDSVIEALAEYGRALGLAFQITDDVLNVTGDAETMGKAVNSDASRQKVTFPELLGVDRARDHARACIAAAQQALNPFADSAWFFTELAEYVLARKS
jgi:geranylgeranyl pyrophosphate synthase